MATHRDAAMTEQNPPRWEAAEVRAPALERPVPAVVARAIPTTPNANRLQNLSIYLPATPEALALVGSPATSLPAAASSGTPHCQVHVHGGAWRDPMTDAASIEPAVAYAFASPEAAPVAAVASLNYTLTEFPNHPVAPYDAAADGHADPAREAVHPAHVRDVLLGLDLLRSYGLGDGSYVLTAHSCGACIAMQAVLAAPSTYGLAEVPEPPVPAAVVGINGLYDLPGLVLGLGAAHEVNAHDYRVMLAHAFGPDDRVWAAASPARLDPARIAERVRAGRAPGLVWIAQSLDDQLVPTSQLQRLAENLRRAEGLRIEIGDHVSGRHAAPWQEGTIIRDAVQDVLRLLAA